MKKVVVFFPFPNSTTLGQKVFEVVSEGEEIEANNTNHGFLVIMVKADLPKYRPHTLAVFKEWVYWERITEPIKDE